MKPVGCYVIHKEHAVKLQNFEGVKMNTIEVEFDCTMLNHRDAIDYVKRMNIGSDIYHYSMRWSDFK